MKWVLLSNFSNCRTPLGARRVKLFSYLCTASIVCAATILHPTTGMGQSLADDFNASSGAQSQNDASSNTLYGEATEGVPAETETNVLIDLSTGSGAVGSSKNANAQCGVINSAVFESDTTVQVITQGLQLITSEGVVVGGGGTEQFELSASDKALNQIVIEIKPDSEYTYVRQSENGSTSTGYTVQEPGLLPGTGGYERNKGTSVDHFVPVQKPRNLEGILAKIGVIQDSIFLVFEFPKSEDGTHTQTVMNESYFLKAKLSSPQQEYLSKFYGVKITTVEDWIQARAWVIGYFTVEIHRRMHPDYEGPDAIDAATANNAQLHEAANKIALEAGLIQPPKQYKEPAKQQQIVAELLMF